MKNYYVYHTPTGVIELVGSTDGDITQLSVATDCIAVEGECDYLRQYVKDGQLVDMPPEQQGVYVTQLWRRRDFDFNACAYPAIETSEVMLENSKLVKWSEIKELRAAKCAEVLTVGAISLDATPVSQQQINGAVTLAMLAPSDWTIDWTLADNTTASLSKAEMIAVGVALGQRTSAIYAAGRVIREAIEAATTTAEVEAITWP